MEPSTTSQPAAEQAAPATAHVISQQQADEAAERLEALLAEPRMEASMFVLQSIAQMRTLCSRFPRPQIVEQDSLRLITRRLYELVEAVADLGMDYEQQEAFHEHFRTAQQEK